MAIKGLTEGRIVHYVLPEGVNKGEHRPAIVVKVWDAEYGTSNLHVFPDYSNDHYPNGPFWATSVNQSDEHEPGTWHFIEYVE